VLDQLLDGEASVAGLTAREAGLVGDEAGRLVVISLDIIGWVLNERLN